jgi:hypothetical protein
MPTKRRVTVVLAGLTLLVFVASVPGSLRDVLDRGGFYSFSREFLDDIPKRLTGPGRFRFVLSCLSVGLGGGSRRCLLCWRFFPRSAGNELATLAGIEPVSFWLTALWCPAVLQKPCLTTDSCLGNPR